MEGILNFLMVYLKLAFMEVKAWMISGNPSYFEENSVFFITSTHSGLVGYMKG